MVAEEEKRRESQPNLFKKSAAEEKRSKIFAALNPEKLFYESQREKQENSEETVQVGTPHGADNSAMPRHSVRMAPEGAGCESDGR